MNDLVTGLLTASAVLHLHHLRASNHAQHEVLNEAYEKATECADAVLEQVLAIDPTALNAVSNLQTGVGDSGADFLEDLVECLASTLVLSDRDSTAPGLSKVLQDYIADFQRLIYQLRLAEA